MTAVTRMPVHFIRSHSRHRCDFIVSLSILRSENAKAIPVLASLAVKPGSEPVKVPAHRMPLHKPTVLSTNINTMAKGGLISPTISPWCANVVLPRKPASLPTDPLDKQYRFVVDYIQLNRLIEGDGYQLPLTDTILEVYQGLKVLCID